ncbi:MAG: MBL fold metallo-hydrolase [Verrucomicrobiota bacterium]
MAARAFKFLGTGTSVGVPVIGCDCAVCVSNDPRNKRLRSSVLVTSGDLKILVDSGPDLRAQALAHRLHAIDAVLYTHAHLDHVVGFDELRAFCWHREQPLPIYATAATMSGLKTMFGWAFSNGNKNRGYVRPAPNVMAGPFEIGDLRITPLPVEHGSVDTVGFMFEGPDGARIAYLPDVKAIPAATMEMLRNVDVLAIDALRPVPHPTHLSLDESLGVIRETGARAAWLTHLSHDHDHAALENNLPAHIRPAWDELEIPW